MEQHNIANLNLFQILLLFIFFFVKKKPAFQQLTGLEGSNSFIIYSLSVVKNLMIFGKFE